MRKAVAEAGQMIEPAAARLLAERAGVDIVRLRGDIERLMLYAAGKPNITLADARKSSAPSRHTTTGRSPTPSRTATRGRRYGSSALALDAGAVSYQVLGQLAWFVRDKMSDPRRIPAAVDALFRADLDLKSSGGDPRVVLERLVVELCGRRGVRFVTRFARRDL